MTEYYLGIDLGGTFIKSAVMTREAEIVGRGKVPTEPGKGVEALIARTVAAAGAAVEDAAVKMDGIRAIGLAAAGIVLVDEGIVVTSPNIPEWRDVPLRNLLARRTGLPVVIENDANAAAWGEYWLGAGRDIESMVMLTLGTGIGGGIIVDGELLRGAHGAGAELGHIAIELEGGRRCGCGNTGCLETLASANGTVRRLVDGIRAGAECRLSERVLAGEEVTSKEIYECAVAGDAYCRGIIHETGRYLGVGIGILMVTLDMEKVVLAGGLAAAGTMLLDGIREEFPRRMYPYMAERLEVVFAELGNDAGVIGAVGCALKRLGTSR